MKKYSYVWMWFAVLVVSLSSCRVVGGIFKAGMWFGIIIVAAIIMLILWLVGRGRR
ncbi:MAG: phosphatidate cytidylyltransferase [Candidatus Dadabacteria bacterium]